jgi:hypothetical protein
MQQVTQKLKVTESNLADLERFLKKYFSPSDEGKVKLRKL